MADAVFYPPTQSNPRASFSGNAGESPTFEAEIKTTRHEKLNGRDLQNQHPIGAITGLQEALNSKQPTINDLEDIRAGANKGSSAVQPNELEAVAETIPHNASDVNALPDTTKYGASLLASINQSTFVITIQLKDQQGNNLGSAQTIDLPLESVVVDGTYDSTNKKIILTLENGNTIDVPVGDLVAGLQTEITAQNKLSADLVSDTNTTNKFVTSAEKTSWYNKISGVKVNGSELTPDANKKVDISVPTSNDYWTVGTYGSYYSLQETYSPKRIEYMPNEDGQDYGLAVMSANPTFEYVPYAGTWNGRMLVGNVDRSFLLGTATSNGSTTADMCCIGAHTWSPNLAWDDIYLNTDGNKTVYIGGNNWTKNSGWFKVENSGSNSGGKVQVNTGTITDSVWKDVAYKGENISDFNNDSGYLTLASLSGYATEQWVQNRGYMTQAVDDDSTTSTTLGWSASKLNGIIGDIESTINAIRGV